MANPVDPDRVAEIAGRLFGSIKRSMCSTHFDEFHSFENHLNPVAHLVASADPIVQENLFLYFPQSPIKIQRETWIGFDNWLRSEMGAPLHDMCFNWCFYGRYTLRTCSAWLQIVNEEIEIDSESDDSDTDGEDESDLDGEGDVDGNEEMADDVDAADDADAESEEDWSIHHNRLVHPP